MICEDVRAAFLAGDESGAFDRHVSGCSSCRADRARLERLRAELAAPAQWDEPTSTMHDLVAAITQRIRPLERRNRGARRFAWAVAAAAAVIVAGVVTLAARNSADWSVALTGAEAAPEASGTVSGWAVDGGDQLLLRTTGLDVAPEGSVYELWFMSGSEAVSAGTFTDPGEVRLMVGVRWRDYPDVLVTLQGSADPLPSDTWMLWNDWNQEED